MITRYKVKGIYPKVDTDREHGGKASEREFVEINRCDDTVHTIDKYPSPSMVKLLRSVGHKGPIKSRGANILDLNELTGGKFMGDEEIIKSLGLEPIEKVSEEPCDRKETKVTIRKVGPFAVFKGIKEFEEHERKKKRR